MVVQKTVHNPYTGEVLDFKLVAIRSTVALQIKDPPFGGSLIWLLRWDPNTVDTLGVVGEKCQ